MKDSQVQEEDHHICLSPIWSRPDMHNIDVSVKLVLPMPKSQQKKSAKYEKKGNKSGWVQTWSQKYVCVNDVLTKLVNKSHHKHSCMTRAAVKADLVQNTRSTKHTKFKKK